MSIVDRLHAAISQLRSRGTRQRDDDATLDATGNDYDGDENDADNDSDDADNYDADRGLDSSRFFNTFGEG